MIATWQAPLSANRSSEELVVAFDQNRDRRVLILPALFDEANKLRRFTVELMRKLDSDGIDSFLSDFPGWNESLVPLEAQTLSDWQNCARMAATEFGATHVLTVRGGALVAPSNLPGWQYAPQSGAKLLRSLLRARVIASKEAGREETTEELSALGRSEGLVLAGYSISSAMFCELETAQPASAADQECIEQKSIGGAGLWLRAEPSENTEQSLRLAAILGEVDSDAGGAEQ